MESKGDEEDEQGTIGALEDRGLSIVQNRMTGKRKARIGEHSGSVWVSARLKT